MQPDITALRAECRSGDPDRQIPALIELIKIHDENSLSEIVPLLGSSDEQVRAEAARAVGYLGGAQTMSLGQQLLPLLSDAEELVRDEAVEALGLLIYPPAIDPLKRILHTDSSWLVRSSAAEALGNYQDASILPDLEQVLRDSQEEPTVQTYAAHSLGLIADSAYRPTLDTFILQSGEPQVLSALLAASYRLGGQQHLDPLLDLLQRADERESWCLLSDLQDLVERRQPPTLAADAPRIRAALLTLSRRWPLTAQQVQQIVGKLPSP